MRRSLGQILTGYGIISDTELDNALALQKHSGLRLGEQLEELGYCTVEDVEWALSAQFDLPLVRLTSTSVDPAAARLVPAGLARAGTLIPIWAVGEDVGVVVADPTNKQVADAVVEAIGKQVQFSLGVPSEIRKAIDAVFGESDPEDARFDAVFGLYDTEFFTEAEKKKINGDPTGVIFLNSLFEKAVEVQARAIYFEHRQKRTQIRIRGERGQQHLIVCQADWFNQLLDRLEIAANARPAGALGAMRGRYIIESDAAGDRWGFEMVCAPSGAHRTATCKPFLRRAVSPDITDIDFGGNVGTLADALHGANTSIVIADIPNMSSVWLLRALTFALNESDQSVIVLGDPAQVAQERLEDRNYKLFDIHAFRDKDLATAYRELAEFAPDTMIFQNAGSENPLPLLEEARLAGQKFVTTYKGVSTLDAALNLHAADAKGLQTAEGLVLVAGVPVNVLCDDCKTEVAMGQEARARYGIADDTQLFRSVGCKTCRMTGLQRIDFVGEVLALTDVVKQAILSQDVATVLTKSGWEPVATRLSRLLAEGKLAVADYVRSMRNIG